MKIISYPVKKYERIYTSGFFVDSTSPKTASYLHSQLSERMEMTFLLEKLVSPEICRQVPESKEQSNHNPRIFNSKYPFKLILNKSPEKNLLSNY